MQSVRRAWLAGFVAALILSPVASRCLASTVAFSNVPSDVYLDCTSAVPVAATVLAVSDCPTRWSDQQLVWWYPFAESNAFTAVDGGSNGYTATNVAASNSTSGAVWSEEGQPQGSMLFDAASALVTGPVAEHATYFDVASCQLTLCAWVRLTNRTTQTIMGDLAGASGLFRLEYNAVSNKYRFTMRNSAYNRDYSTDGAVTGRWQHVAVVVNIGSVAMYVDGVRYFTAGTASAAANTYTPAPFALGATRLAREGLQGNLDDARFYARVLSSNEIFALARSGGRPDVLPTTLTSVTNSACPRTIERTWSATDLCGTSSSVTQRIVFIDAVAPGFPLVPPGSVASVDALPGPIALISTDNCSAAVAVWPVAVTSGSPPSVFTRTWTRIDPCGNAATAVQTIALQPLPGIVFSNVPGDIVVTSSVAPMPDEVLAYSSCGAQPDGGVLVHLPLDGVDSGTVSDISGNWPAYPLGGAPSVQAGMRDTALRFSASNQIVTLGNLQTAATWTVAFWIRADALATAAVFAAGNGSLSPRIALRGEKLQLESATPGIPPAITLCGMLTTGAWVHVAAVISPTQVWAYCNGLETAKVTGAFATYFSAWSAARVGEAAVSATPWTGALDDFRIYPRPLSAQELARLHGDTRVIPLPVTLTETVTGSCPRMMVRTWQASDACGQMAAVTQRVLFAVDEQVRLYGVPPSRTIECVDPLPIPAEVGATGAWGRVAVQMVETVTGNCPVTVTRVWTAIDGCGNPVSATQTIRKEALDLDADGVRDIYESGTGRYVSPVNTGTSPSLPDSDGDGFFDGHEIRMGRNPTDAAIRPQATPMDFDGDHVTDLALRDLRTGDWFVQLSTGTQWRLVTGQPWAAPVPADYGGVGRYHVGTYRPACGLWMMVMDAQTDIVQWGYPGTVPVPADYDGDYRADPAVYNASNGLWFVRLSRSGPLLRQFGYSGAMPAPGDFDGDGRADFCVYDARLGRWYQQRSVDGFRTVNYGHPGTFPVVADYDGDGRADVGIFDPRGNVWSFLASTTGPHTVRFSGDGIPFPGDFDGDWCVDPALYQSSGRVLVYASSKFGGFRAIPFVGGSGHLLLPAR